MIPRRPVPRRRIPRFLHRGRATRLVLAAGLLSLLPACDGWVAAPAERDAPELALFDQVWREFDRHYSMFEVRGVNWDSLRAVYRPLAQVAQDDAALAATIGRMLAATGDPHVTLFTPHGLFRDTTFDSARTTFDPEVALYRYLDGYTVTGSGAIHWGSMEDFGYIWIPSFAGAGWTWEIDHVLRSLDLRRALILDIRTNGGGSSRNARAIAGRFLDSERTYAYYRFRNGPSRSDFTDFRPLRVGPAGGVRWTKPVILLTDRRVFSSAEEFVLMLRTAPHVTMLGDTTGGGSGNPLVRELPNGWTYRMSQWLEYTPARELFEGTGLVPHKPVPLDQQPAGGNTDIVLDWAITEARRQ